jgi:F-type H+/Na+-transporting ATPase subunit alpha
MIDSNEIIKQLEKRLSSTSLGAKSEHVGEVVSNNDGVISASGLSRVTLGEMVEFEKGDRGFVLNLGEEYVSIILLSSSSDIKEGDKVKSTGEILSINVSDELVGRVINPIGVPLDEKPNISKKSGKNVKTMPLERIAAGVVERSPVDTPLKTGIKAVDTMIPIGRGQRELIIGDRGLGKTAIALDAIINQRTVQKGNKRVLCVYVAIGQKQSSVSQVIERLRKEKALEYTVVVVAGASDPASLQYLAPYAGTSIAEYFMEKGEDVLVVYDDLTKHAWAYRQLSLVLKRPAGREAYPGDIFYLHSRLLERSVKLNKENGGGSITSLPIIETQASDISAYIPTNVISITDGQIYLQSDLFNLGIRPAINPGNSVSRVGGAAQTKAIKSVSGKLRLELAQYNALAAFAQFGSELDEATTKQLERGKRSVEILKQPQYAPLPESLEIISTWTATNGYLDDVEVESVGRFEKELHDYALTHAKKLVEKLNTGEKLDEKTIDELKKTVEDFKKGANFAK